MENQGPQLIGKILQHKPSGKKPPAYAWQDLALRIIDELGIPGFKRSAVFKVCKTFPKARIEKALNDTKELADGPERWKYFFKILRPDEQAKPDSTPPSS